MNTAMRMVAAMLALFALAGCNRQVDVRIGVAAPMSGTLAQYGKDIVNGAQIAVDELNGDHFLIDGKPARFQLVVEDDQASPEAGQDAARRLIKAGVSAVFGHFNSGVTIAAAPLYSQAGIPQLSVSTNPKYTRMGLETAFRLTADDIEQGATLGRLIGTKLGAKSVFMTDDGTLFGAGLAEEVKKVLGAAGVSPPHEGIDAATDFAAVARKIRESNADVVFFGGDEAVGLPLLKAIRAAQIDAKFVVADAMCDPSTIRNAGGLADNNYYCTVPGVPPSWLSAGIGFSDMYKARFGTPGPYAMLAYDGIHVLAQAMQEANSTRPDQYLPVMKRTAFDGKIQGTVEFDDKGDIRDGTVVVYQSISGELIEQRDLL
jgi:branched-chain amino acid transport system substrate-binding protein